MKLHIGIDSRTGLVHSLHSPIGAASVADVITDKALGCELHRKIIFYRVFNKRMQTMSIPRSRADPTGTVDLSSPYQVLTGIRQAMNRFWPDLDQATLACCIDDVARAFRGDYPGLLRCDTYYHDLRHALDTGLAMARLFDGHAKATRTSGGTVIDAEHALLGVMLALCHDIGLLRRENEAHLQGASLTPVHERRGVGFMTTYLAHTPLAHLAQKAELIMVTRLDYQIPYDLPPIDFAIACLLGTADLMGQLADRSYLEKCRKFLFIEFSAIGLAGGSDQAYPTPEILLQKTPAYYTGLLRQRIHDEYGDADRFMAVHFDGNCPYASSIERNFNYLQKVLSDEDFTRLRRQPERVIDARYSITA